MLILIIRLIQLKVEPIILKENYTYSNLYKTIYDGISIYSIMWAPALIIKTFKYWYNSNILIRDLENKNLEIKLRSLRIQLNPHFFFNSLNNIYSLSLNETKKVPEFILRLSGILRYILTTKSYVLISKELGIINDYIELEKLRYHKGFRLNFENKISEFDQNRILIPPLILFTFIENSFKHGASQVIKNPWIKIYLDFKNTSLIYTISNSLNDKINQKESLGIGLQNIKKRLELYYPNMHNLSIEKDFESFSVRLIIKISKDENNMFNN